MKKGILVSEFYEKLKDKLRLRLVAGHGGLDNRINVAELNRPGLALADYLDYFAYKRIQVFGKAELSYLTSLSPAERVSKLKRILSKKVPCVIIARRMPLPKEFITLANRLNKPLFRSHYMTMKLINKATIFLEDRFAPSVTMSGNEAEVFGVGVLILGKSGVGKSEATLGLISKGHRLVCDDVVKLMLTESGIIVGEGAKMTRHFMELRGIGIINVQTLFGVGCIKESKKVELVVTLEKWNSEKEYERLGMENKYITLLGIKVPHIVIPVQPGRDMISLIEVAALNYRLKKLGINPALELNNKLVEIMQQRSIKKK